MQWNELKSHLRHLSTSDQKRVQNAFEMGKNAHKGQKRKSGEPYFTHPIAVTHILADMGADADTLIASLLHDTVEDTDLNLREIDREFNGDVATLIDGVTKLTPEDVAEMPTLDDQIETLRKMFTLVEEDVRVMVIKLADRMHNMQTIEYLSSKRQQEMAQETLDVYVKIADRLAMQDIRDELEGLSYAVIDQNQHKKLLTVQEQNESRGTKARKEIRSAFDKSSSGLKSSVDIVYERKSWGKLRAQMNMEGNVATGISAVTLVFVCDDIPTCYAVLGVLHQSWSREALSFQDFVNAPMINGYRGLHTTIILKDGARIRCKIRTSEMHEYARRGISTLCFDSEAVGFTDYLLPWTEHITTLSEDTAHQSSQFWENLQSDLLGESIVIHGPDDRQILVPVGSTALDGAFHYYGADALKTKMIMVDGKEVPLSTPLQHAASLNVEFSKNNTVERGWIDWVNSGFSIAKIRESLATHPTSKRIATGKLLLQEVLTKKKKGFIEEFDQQSIQKSLESFGYDDMDQIYIALSEGRIEAADVYKTLFEKATDTADATQKIAYFQFSFPLTDLDTVTRLIDLFRQNTSRYKDLKVRYNPLNGLASAKMQMRLNADETRKYLADIEKAGASNIRTYPVAHSAVGVLLSVSTLLALWGLDPVIARTLLQSIGTADLTFVRFAVFFIASSLLFGVQKFTSGPKLKPLNPLQPTLIFSGIALFLTALFSYITLIHTTASVYILFIIFGVIMVTFLNALLSGNRWLDLAIAAMFMAIGIGIALTVESVSFPTLLFATASSLSFSLYSVTSRRYQQEVEMIHARYPAFLFWLSVSTLPFTLVLLPFTNLATLPLPILLNTIGFVLIFSIVPYGFYFECMKRMRQSILERSLPFVALVALIGEMMLQQSLSAAFLAILGCVGLSILVIQIHHSDGEVRRTDPPSSAGLRTV